MTAKMIFGMTWRGAAWGLLGGTLLGTVYGAIFANVLMFFGLLAQPTAQFQSDDIPRAVFAILFLAFIGAIIGALFGVPTGFVVGLLNGLLIGIITRMFFFPPRDAKTWRRVMAWVCAVSTTLASWFCFFAIMLFYANRDKANVNALAIAVIIPALIAGGASVFISRLIANWYERGARGKGQTETPKEATQ